MGAHTEVFMQGHTNGGNMRVDGSLSGGNNSMYIDPSDYAHAETHGFPVGTNAPLMGVAFFHELGHTNNGTVEGVHDGSPTGEINVIAHENKILHELGLPGRMGHDSEGPIGAVQKFGEWGHREQRREYRNYYDGGAYVSFLFDVP
jgi:hypothetical protein